MSSAARSGGAVIDKEYISARQLLEDAFSLAARIYESGYRPDVLLGIWRGGTPIGIAIHEYLLYHGVDTLHTAVKSESYLGVGEREEPRVMHFESVLETIPEGAKVLLIDDIFDSGRTVEALFKALAPKTRNVRTAMPYYKPDSNLTDGEPDYFLRKTDRWIVFPHELVGLTDAELKDKDPFVCGLLKRS